MNGFIWYFNMSELIYIDTNVWLDYFFNRDSGILSPAEISFELFKRSVSCEFYIVISSPLIFELEKYIDENKLKAHLEWLEPKLIRINLTLLEEKEAKKLPIHYPDCVHLFISQKYSAKLVSNDKELQKLGAISSHIL